MIDKSTEVLIKVENLTKSFGKLQVLKGINQTVRKGEVVSVIGPSGSGKSTFLRCLNLLETPDSGNIYFKGQDITKAGVNIDQYRQKIGMVFQHFNVFPNMTVLQNITLAPILEKKIPKAQAEEKGMKVKEIKLPMSYAGRYLAETDGGKGFIKLVVDTDRNRLVGCHMVGSYASEIIMTATMMVDTELTPERLQKFVFPHPTVAEIIREAIFHI